jgi:3-dehydroquinate synthase class II
MAFYDEMAVMALEMITEFGQSVIIREIKVGEYDPGTGTVLPDTVVEQTAQGILLDFTGQEFQANSLIQVGDKKLKIAAQGLEWPPRLLNKVIVQGRMWSIIPPLKEINPAGTPILYELQVRS